MAIVRGESMEYYHQYTRDIHIYIITILNLNITNNIELFLLHFCQSHL